MQLFLLIVLLKIELFDCDLSNLTDPQDICVVNNSLIDIKIFNTNAHIKNIKDENKMKTFNK